MPKYLLLGLAVLVAVILTATVPLNYFDRIAELRETRGEPRQTGLARSYKLEGIRNLGAAQRVERRGSAAGNAASVLSGVPTCTNSCMWNACIRAGSLLGSWRKQYP